MGDFYIARRYRPTSIDVETKYVLYLVHQVLVVLSFVALLADMACDEPNLVPGYPPLPLNALL